ncbi:MAG: periplasmic heavy metal sensor [Chlorobium phaeobacteroides]|jgi:Spy/CpxP family protein refolding chaperone|nr:periplasmic heavy metal sensor [Chlorobium phaeobacteroides]
MNKKTVTMITAMLLGFSSIASATDYSSYSDAKLSEMRGTMRTASQEERQAYQTECQKRTALTSPDQRSNRAGITRHKTKGSSPMVLKEQLGLSDTQSRQLQEMRQKHAGLATKERSRLAELQRQLMDASMTSNPDKQRIAVLAQQIGKEQSDLAIMRSASIQEVASVLTPKQREKMKTFMLQISPCKQGGMKM